MTISPASNTKKTKNISIVASWKVLNMVGEQQMTISPASTAKKNKNISEDCSFRKVINLVGDNFPASNAKKRGQGTSHLIGMLQFLLEMITGSVRKLFIPINH